MEVQNHKIHCPDVIQRNSLNDCSKVTGSDHMSPACNLCVFVRQLCEPCDYFGKTENGHPGE